MAVLQMVAVKFKGQKNFILFYSLDFLCLNVIFFMSSAGCSGGTVSSRVAVDVQVGATENDQTHGLQLRGPLSLHCRPLLSEEC